ncbi:hypothetical protein CLOSTASPAR_00651 [[Clostridium] asparagiforme DSM 15981]|uniref:Uncharacterized protein n=1 Tax=[Clostridium] asparagiforme DSM 15981 TaxID=518636 RepID=C0CUW2_9FIRM|nr:hypothetical protein CLOSTASPAR_00651 [[Clostridium] asparagiforme DSM 15981]
MTRPALRTFLENAGGRFFRCLRIISRLQRGERPGFWTCVQGDGENLALSSRRNGQSVVE